MTSTYMTGYANGFANGEQQAAIEHREHIQQLRLDVGTLTDINDALQQSLDEANARIDNGSPALINYPVKKLGKTKLAFPFKVGDVVSLQSNPNMTYTVLAVKSSSIDVRGNASHAVFRDLAVDRFVKVS